MSTVAMVTVSTDVPFETDDEIAQRLAHYEDQFRHRYTKADDSYLRTCERSGRWYQVPVMNPWPPKRVYGKKKRYEDLDSGPHRRGGYYSDRRNRDRGGPVYPSRDKYSHHDSHYYGHSGWGRNSRSPRAGYYGSEGYGRHSRSPHRSSPPPSRHAPSWDQGHTPSHDSHTHTSHQPPPVHPDHSHYDYQHEQAPLKSGSHSPGSFLQQFGPSPPTEGVDYHYEPKTGGPFFSPGRGSGHESLGETKDTEHTISKGEGDATNKSCSAIEEDMSSQSETDTSSVKIKAPPPPPLDLSSVIGSEEDQKLVPSQSDVLDILSTASKASNEVTSENLRQVKRETQIHAARKTMKTRDKSSSGKPSTKKFRNNSQKEMLSVSHGHAKNVSQSRVLEGGASKPLSKTHALLQESIAAAEATSNLQGTTSEAYHTVGDDSKAKVQGDVTDVKKKRKRRNVIKHDTCSSSENEELDVVTPVSGSASLSVSLRRDVMSESSHFPPVKYTDRDSENDGRKHGHGKITLSVDDLASDVSDVDEVMDTIKPTVAANNDPLWVRINRKQISKHYSNLSTLDEDLNKMEHHDCSDSSLDPQNYAVEVNPHKLTKMVIRAQPCAPTEVKDHDLILEEVNTEENTLKKAKKKKKKAKHKKIKTNDDLKLKILL